MYIKLGLTQVSFQNICVFILTAKALIYVGA